MQDSEADNSKRVFFVVNNRSGNANEPKLRELVEEKFENQGYDCHFFIRDGKGQSRRKATRQAVEEGFPIIVAVGGDGTVSKVADEIQGSAAVLGIVPSGSANLIAKSLELPPGIEQSLDVIRQNDQVRSIDGMRVGKKTYFCHISLGVYSLVARQEPKTGKKIVGKLAYLWPLFKEMRRRLAWRFRVESPEFKKSLKASLIMVANVGDAGFGGMKWGEDIRPDDGQVDLCLVRGRGMRAYSEFVWNALRGRANETSHMEHIPIKSRVHISAKTNLAVRADGSLIGEKEVDIEVVKRAVKVIVGSPHDD